MKRKFWKTKRSSAKWPFFAGLGAGAALGMLIAPKSGSELRGDLQDFARDSYEQGRERLQPVIDQTREKLEPVVNEARQRVEPVINNARERAGAVAEQVRQGMDSVSAQAASVRDRVMDKASDLKERVTNGGLLAILNDWPHERLIEIEGIGPVLATRIIQHRPYKSEQEFTDLKDFPPSAIENLKKAA